MNGRYSRQILFPPIGEAGQQKLAKKHVLIIGLGALGTQSAEMLARSGIGRLTIADRDYIEWSNLQRQQLYIEKDAVERLPKAVAAKRHLQAINSEITIDAHILDVTPEDLEQLVSGVDLILDATDNFDIRLMINDIAQKYRIPWIYGSCVGSYGISYTIIPGETPCLNCLLETVPVGGQTCDTAGIISPAASQVVIYQTTEALKMLTENWQDLRKNLVSFDLWKNEHVQMDMALLKKADCPSCGQHRTYPFLSYEKQTKTAVLCGRSSVQIRPAEKGTRDLNELAKKLAQTGGQVECSPFLLTFSIDEERMVMFQDGRALIHGTNDIDKAKALYYRYLS